MKQSSKVARIVLMLTTALVIAALAVMSGGWGQALAQGTVGIQPLPSETAAAPKIASQPCDQTMTLYDINDVKIASAVLTPKPAVGNLCTLLQVIPESNPAFPVTFPEFQVAATGLFGVGSTTIPAAPGGYTRLTDAVQFAGLKGPSLNMCFVVPAGSSSYKSLRIAYFDVTPNINRWVFLRTGAISNGEICMSRGLRSPIPAVFSLFGQN
jgi:hypothetical protein